MSAQIQPPETWLSRYLYDRYGDTLKTRFRKQRQRHVSEPSTTYQRPIRISEEPISSGHHLFDGAVALDLTGPEFEFCDPL